MAKAVTLDDEPDEVDQVDELEEQLAEALLDSVLLRATIKELESQKAALLVSVQELRAAALGRTEYSR
jgi:hypothetical protein